MSMGRGKAEARAVWLASAGQLELRPESVPPPGAREVQVRTLVSAPSHGTEMLVYRGQVPAGTPLDLPTLSGSFAFPIKYGYAAVGRIVGVGDAVSSLSAGDVVFVHHPHQTLFNVDASMPVRLPPALSPEHGVFLANAETALNIVLDAAPRLTENVVVFGQGTVGLLVAQLLRRAGAGIVITVDPIELRRSVSRTVAADLSLPPGPEVASAVQAATGGRGADIVVEVSGSPSALQSAVDCAADEALVVAASWYGTKPVELQLGGHFHRGRVGIRSSQVGRINPALAPRWDRARRTEAVLSLLPELRLDELTTQRVPFADAAAAYELLDQNPCETLQLLLTY